MILNVDHHPPEFSILLSGSAWLWLVPALLARPLPAPLRRPRRLNPLSRLNLQRRHIVRSLLNLQGPLRASSQPSQLKLSRPPPSLPLRLPRLRPSLHVHLSSPSRPPTPLHQLHCLPRPVTPVPAVQCSTPNDCGDWKRDSAFVLRRIGTT